VLSLKTKKAGNIMLKHILLWKFKDEYKENEVEFDKKVKILHKMFSGMAGKIDGLIKAEIGKDISGGNYDIVLYSEFVNKAALDGYKIHPLHLEVKELSKDWVTNKTIIDYLI